MGAEIATALVQEILGIGMPAANASAATRPQLNDLVIEDTLLSVQQGSAGERVSIGFGVGGSELKVAVEGFSDDRDRIVQTRVGRFERHRQ